MLEKIEAQMTPVDIVSHLPLPVISRASVDGEVTAEEVLHNRHHAMHPRSALEGPGLGLGPSAVRHCRIQDLPVTLHNAYHRQFIGPELPRTQQERLRLVVFASAGYIPDEGLQPDEKGVFQPIALEEEERLHLWRSKQIRIETPDKVRKFLLQYAVDHGVPAANLNESLVDEFLHTRQEERRRQLGRHILHVASEVVTFPFNSDYMEARRARRIPPERSRRAGSFVCNLVTLQRSGRINERSIHSLRSYLRSAC